MDPYFSYYFLNFSIKILVCLLLKENIFLIRAVYAPSRNMIIILIVRALVKAKIRIFPDATPRENRDYSTRCVSATSPVVMNAASRPAVTAAAAAGLLSSQNEER